MTPVCPYCENPAILVTGAKVYPKRVYLHGLRFWLCGPCDAYVGCHKEGAYIWVDGVKVVSDGTLPLGRLADAELRRWKANAHTVFDPMWKGAGMTRVDAYKWLAKQLKLNASQCHIGMFDIAQCKAVIAAVKARRPTPPTEG